MTVTDGPGRIGGMVSERNTFGLHSMPTGEIRAVDVVVHTFHGEPVNPDEAVAFADAALGAAGHEVDEATREIGRRVSSGELTADEVVAAFAAESDESA